MIVKKNITLNDYYMNINHPNAKLKIIIDILENIIYFQLN